MMTWPFVPHRQYVRRSAIHEAFGGNQQNGMSVAPRSNAIFLFTGSGGKPANYRDGFISDGSFRYTGEGQSGDQRFTMGNLALRDHQVRGYDVLLFEKVGTTPRVTFLGQFVCSTYDIERQIGRDGKERDAIVFLLTPLEAVDVEPVGDAAETDTDLAALRRRAYAAAAPAQKRGSAAPRSVYHRSADVKAYVLARAKGDCEACKVPAPFNTKAGTPYLEPHHIDRLSDGGPDSPDKVAAICPNCHREVHHGLKGSSINDALRTKIATLEAEIQL